MTLKSQPIKEDGRRGLSRTEHLLPPSARDRHQEGRTSRRPGEDTADTHPTKHLCLQHFENFLISVTRKQERDLSRLVTGERQKGDTDMHKKDAQGGQSPVTCRPTLPGDTTSHP